MKAVAATVEVTAELEQARNLMRRHELDCMPVLSGARLVGLLNARDLLAADIRGVADAMRVNIRVVHGDAVLRDVLEVFSQNGANMLPVVNVGHELLGVVTAADLVKVFGSSGTRRAANEPTLVEVRSADIHQPADDSYHRALLAAFRMHASQDPDGVAHALLYSDRRNLVLDKAFNIARRYVFAGQSPQELSRLRRAIEEVRDFDEKAGQSRRIPTGRM